MGSRSRLVARRGHEQALARPAAFQIDSPSEPHGAHACAAPENGLLPPSWGKLTTKLLFVSRFFAGLGLLLAIAPAQTVWVVTTATGMQPAINAASPGDVIWVATPNVYAFTLNKGLTIRGNDSIASYVSQFVPHSVSADIPPGQVAHIERLSFTSGILSPLGFVGCPVHVTGGSVRFEGCTFLAGDPLQISNASVVVTGGTVTGVGPNSHLPAIVATDSNVTLRDCVITGANSSFPWPGYPLASLNSAHPALRATNSVIHAERVQFVGGSHNSFPVSDSGAPGISVQGGSVWLADCALTAGSSYSGAGGTALVHAGTAAVELRGTTLTAGLPGGLPSSGPVNSNAPLLRLELAPAWLRGSTSVLSLHGDPNTLFALGVAPDTVPTALPGLVVEPLWFVGGTSVFGGVLDAAGNATHSVAVPNVAMLEHRTFWCQAVAGSSLPLRASTIAGGVVN